MPDRYLPSLASFGLTAEEQAAVTLALASPDPWKWNPGAAQAELIVSAKNKIRDHHLLRHGEKCCYCRTNLHGTGHFTIDREHILPKSIAAYRGLSYEIWNLGIACKRCNMEYKKDKIDFVVSPQDTTLFGDGANYLFVHPNFDLYREHLSRSSLEEEESVLVKYTVVEESLKGAYTYEYFNLRGLEINSFDLAQGLDANDSLSEGALEVRSLADEYRQ